MTTPNELATASDRFKLPDGLDLNSLVKTQGEAIERLTRQLDSAMVANQKLEAYVIGLRQQVVDLKICIAKLKAIRNELRNILWLKSKELEGR